ncbi:Phosphorylated carbohydrates phosphatase [Hordeum vulgare]|nr:Phosphorylated carbohydrates phosphatase [Hordeum vulgare]
MSSSNNRSDEELDPDFQLVLRVALERSRWRPEATLDLQPRRFLAGAAPDLEPHRFLVGAAPTSALAPPGPCAASTGGLRNTRHPYVIPYPPVGCCSSKVRASRREWQRQRERWEAEQCVRRRHAIEAEPDKDAQLLEWVYRRSLTTAETDARRLRRKNTKALRIAIEQSEREAAVATTEAARLAKLKRQRDKEV